jgi:phosphatidylcholine synthase
MQKGYAVDTGSHPDNAFMAIISAWLVHLLTASGAVFGLLAMSATADGRYVMALLWMAVTTAIDGVDGTLARKFQVKKFLPQFDGALLDNIVDYFTYVLVPAYFLLHVDVLPKSWRLPVAFLILLASAYQFCRVDAKTPDHTFTGFPSYWNVAVFYLFLLSWPWQVNAALLILCAVGVFIPVRYLYPSRTPILKPINITLGLVWAAMLLVALKRFPEGHEPVVLLSFFYILYYLLFSIWLTLWRKRHPKIVETS